MNTMNDYPRRTRLISAAVALAALLAAPTLAHAQAAPPIDPSLASNGGDTRDIVPGDTTSGEMFSTIGEPIAEDSTNTVDNGTTWTGFWQVTPIGPVAAVRDEKAAAPATSGIVTTLPDPFTVQTEIRVTMQTTTRLQLEIYDLLGRYVGTLLDEQREAGLHRIAWRPEGIAPGGYMVVMQEDGQPVSARLIRYIP